MLGVVLSQSFNFGPRIFMTDVMGFSNIDKQPFVGLSDN